MAAHVDFCAVQLEKPKREVFQLCQKLGSGSIMPVPYDTAWVARVPETDNLSRPAFPTSLQWLRKHQRFDGSWGSEHSSLHGKILNTFTSTLAFCQWNLPEDEERINRAIEALTTLSKTLPNTETIENVFEMILSALLDEAQDLGLHIPYENFEWYSAIGKKKLENIESEISKGPNKYWTLLEAAGKTIELELECFRPEINQYGLIAAQPSTTAFILRRARLDGVDFPEAAWTLQNMCAQNDGGVPHFSSCDNFEVIHSLDFLFTVNINPRINVKYAGASKALKKLQSRLNSKKEVGFSSNWPFPDRECSKTAARVIERSVDVVNDNREANNRRSEAAKTIPKIYVDQWPLEDHQDLSNNDSLPNPPLCMKENHFSEELHSADETFLGIQNTSKWYNVLQEVSHIQAHDTKTTTEILLLIRSHQHNDGGWGNEVVSSTEETAYVCLALFLLIQKQPDVMKYINFNKLANFIDNVNTSPVNSCWCYKVDFSSAVVSAAAILAARHAIYQIHRLCIMQSAFNDNQLQLMDIAYSEADDQPLYQGYFVLRKTEPEKQEIEDVEEILAICRNILQVEQPDAYLKTVLTLSLELSYFTLPEKMSSYNRAVDVMFLFGLFLIDDVVDEYLQGKNNLKQACDEFLSVLCKILRGDLPNLEAVPEINFPRFRLLAQWFFFHRKVLEEQHCNAEYLVKLLEKQAFKSVFLTYKQQRLGVPSTSKRYLYIHKLDVGLFESTYLRGFLSVNIVDSSEFENYKLFTKFQECAEKAIRILIDAPSVQKDLRKGQSDNYCIQLKNEYEIPLKEALARTIKKGNKEMLRLYSLKQIILRDPEHKNDKNLQRCMKYVEDTVNGLILWSLVTSRYQSQRKLSLQKVDHKEGDLNFIYDLCFH